jgi:hypothetical protein
VRGKPVYSWPEWRQSPARSAAVSRDNPTSTRAAWSCEPVMRISGMEKLCVGGDCEQRQFGSPSHGRWARMQRPGGGNSDGRAARGSVAPRKMACRLARGDARFSRFKAINSRTGKGQPDRCPFQSRFCLLGKMDPKTTHVLALLAALSLVCTAVAWAVDYAVFSSVFAALAAVAVLGAAAPRPRR